MGWKIRAMIPRMGGGPPLYEYYYVAIPEFEKAQATLRQRKNLLDAELENFGEIPDNDNKWLNLQPGETRCVITVS